MGTELKPGKYWLMGIPHDFKRCDRMVEVIGRVPMEQDYYRVRYFDRDGIGIASASMLKSCDEVRP